VGNVINCLTLYQTVPGTQNEHAARSQSRAFVWELVLKNYYVDVLLTYLVLSMQKPWVWHYQHSQKGSYHFYVDSGAGQYSHNGTWRICKCTLMPFFVSLDSNISNVTNKPKRHWSDLRLGWYSDDKWPAVRLIQRRDQRPNFLIISSRGAQIPGARSPWRLNFVRWRLIFVCPQCGTCCLSPFWRLEFSGGPTYVENFSLLIPFIYPELRIKSFTAFPRTHRFTAEDAMFRGGSVRNALRLSACI
jgi:hypothetical protein